MRDEMESGNTSSIKGLVADNYRGNINDFSTDALTLFEFLTLIVNIKYRVKYGKVFEDQRGSGYSSDVQSNKVLADHVSPVDDGLLGL